MTRLRLALLCVAAVAAVPVAAHHSFARDYFEDQTVSLEGRLVEFQFKSPHSILLISAKDERGETQTFAAEWNNANRLSSAGVTRDTFKPGDYLILSGSPGRRPEEHRLHLKHIERPADGSTWGRTGRGRGR